MRRLLGSRRRTVVAAALASVAVVVAAGYGYAGVTGTDPTYTGCLQNGTISNVGIGSDPFKSCPKNSTQISWNKTGPPGPPGNTDSTVRHISQFMFDGVTATTPILSARGEVGKLSLFCDHDANGGNGEIRFTQSSDPSFQNRVIFYSPETPSSPTQVLANPQATFPWTDTPGDNIIFEMMIEAEPGTDPSLRPTLTDIHGFVQHFSFGGCSFFVHVDTSEINSGETFTP
jgi:hypothetical protein